ncbi:VanZ family protein [Gluconacetobacter tumulisoli]|uniref:VanZ family protein n=1 Tax=Gluconacetobacter tumulisoli TaxID=1286189 RepID=A0A7W4PLI0_9PROT|nr:VanZ family protein [Gluconacetobacter tumulisoli]MBB2200664.1 VanZ family protein [Gluconacetobacter tumulisoli]
MVRFFQIAAAGLALFIVFVTLGPLSDRPGTGHPQAERFAAYFILGAFFSLAYPRHRLWVAIGVVAGSIALELGQLAVPGRDAGVPDAIAKALGGMMGIAAISAMAYLGRATRES